MSRNPLRKAVQMVGFDVHRYHPAPDALAVLQTLGIQTVVDVGANVGQFAKEIRSLLPNAHIHSFEPLSDCYRDLVKAMSGDAHFTPYHMALGETVNEVKMHRSSYAPSSSLLPMAQMHKDLFPHTSGISDEVVSVRRLDDVLASMDLQSEILLKIDVQGYEDKVLAGASRTLAQTRAVLTEASFVPLYEGQPLFEDIYRLLRAAGFSYQGGLQHKRDPQGAILFEDALFLRT